MSMIKASASGYFKPKVIRKNGDVDQYGFNNLILNSGITAATSGTSGITAEALLANCAVGTGTALPVVTQTALSAQVALSPAGSFVSGSYSYDAARDKIITEVIMSYSFVAGSVSGAIAEFGIKPVAGSSLFSRALVTDAGGLPDVINVGIDDQLIVEYILRGECGRTVSGTFDIGGLLVGLTAKYVGNGALNRAMPFNLVTTSLMTSASAINSDVYAFPAWNGTPALPSGVNATAAIVTAENTDTSIKRRFRIAEPNLNIAGGFNWLRFTSAVSPTNTAADPSWIISFSSDVAKDATNKFEIEFSTFYGNDVNRITVTLTAGSVTQTPRTIIIPTTQTDELELVAGSYIQVNITCESIEPGNPDFDIVGTYLIVSLTPSGLNTEIEVSSGPVFVDEGTIISGTISHDVPVY